MRFAGFATILVVAIGTASFFYQQNVRLAESEGKAIESQIEAEEKAALLTAEYANRLSREGSVDAALLALLDASKVFTSETVPDSFLIAFENALRRSETERRHLIPADANVFAIDHHVFFKSQQLVSFSLCPKMELQKRLET